MGLLEKLVLPKIDKEFKCDAVVIEGETYISGVEDVRFVGTGRVVGSVYVDKKLEKRVTREIEFLIPIALKRGCGYEEFLEYVSDSIDREYSKMSQENMDICFKPIYDYYSDVFKS
ncbi:hypothetical protein KAI32_01950 [Candidatus Pacearchaeota archaeon]|nr:hypothetical protein [Candidatus Pacearchaeota archaeon]